MSKVLILFAHPLLEKSRVHTELLLQAQTLSDVTINDLYQNYPDFDIDVEKEQSLLLENDIIIWQHPLYWYSAPAILKQWQDLVLEHGWAYGKYGFELSGKKIFNVITSGGSEMAYQNGGLNKYPINDFLKPFERTAELCKTTYWPPYWVPGVHRLEIDQIKLYGIQYKKLLTALKEDIFSEEDILKHTLLNHLVPIQLMQ